MAIETRCPFQCGRARVNAVTESKDRETVPERWNAAGPGSDMWMDTEQDGCVFLKSTILWGVSVMRRG